MFYIFIPVYGPDILLPQWLSVGMLDMKETLILVLNEYFIDMVQAHLIYIQLAAQLYWYTHYYVGHTNDREGRTIIHLHASYLFHTEIFITHQFILGRDMQVFWSHPFIFTGKLNPFSHMKIMFHLKTQKHFTYNSNPKHVFLKTHL